jgi:ferritin-like metal-binding protein YciE
MLSELNQKTKKKNERIYTWQIAHLGTFLKNQMQRHPNLYRQCKSAGIKDLMRKYADIIYMQHKDIRDLGEMKETANTTLIQFFPSIHEDMKETEMLHRILHIHQYKISGYRNVIRQAKRIGRLSNCCMLEYGMKAEEQLCKEMKILACQTKIDIRLT